MNNLPAQKAILMLWIMLTTNNDVFQGVAAGGDITPIQTALAGITGLDAATKTDMINETVKIANFQTFASLRTKFQSFAAGNNAPWPPNAVGVQQHPTLPELQTNIFQP